MAKKSIAIVGHGIAGTSLALTCLRSNIPFQLYGISQPGEASWASSGLIAPITGRRYVKTWRIDELLPYAIDFYRWSERVLQSTYFRQVEIARFLSNQEAHRAWHNRMQDPAYLEYICDKKYPELDVLDKPYGIMCGAYQLDTKGWLDHVHAYLKQAGLFEAKEIALETPDREKQIVIWATGTTFPVCAHGIVPNKGEALLVRMPGWPFRQVIKDDMYIVPMKDHTYWTGSYYERYPDRWLPTREGRANLLEKLGNIYRGPIEVIRQLAGVRPTVLDRRPIIGAHPGIPGDFIFNGMGTKGTSLAPFWAEQLISHIVDGIPLSPEVSPARYPK